MLKKERMDRGGGRRGKTKERRTQKVERTVRGSEDGGETEKIALEGFGED